MYEEKYSLIEDAKGGGIVRVDVRWKALNGIIMDFSINISLMETDKISEVYRIDTKHGHLHEHRFWRAEDPVKLEGDFNTVFIQKKDEAIGNCIEWAWLLKKRRKNE